MLDTRTYRSEPAQENSTILGSAQLQSLLAYLSTPEPAGVRWKFIASSVPFTKNWHVGTTDTWGGFLGERRAVFEAMWRAERELGIRVVLLSGDRHEFGATRFPDPSLDNLAPSDFAEGAGTGVHEFSVGPLSMFYLPIRSYYQTDDQDVAIKYVPNGNSKFGLIDIEDSLDELSSESGSVRASVLTYSLYVDGDVVWRYQLSLPLDRGSGATAAKPASRFPPGRVLEDNVLPARWAVLVKNAIGRAEELGKCTALKARDLYYDLLEKIRKTERLE
jgi:alkaline phosphatase D